MINVQCSNKPDARVCVVGLGYVGLPLAVAFGKTDLEVYGFDINAKKIAELKEGFDSMGEVSKEELAATRLQYSSDPAVISKANFIIVAVPTPVDKAHKPDLYFVESASKVVGEHLSAGSVVVFESTVYPGVTEEICVPIIEKTSGLKCGTDWKIGYSPERINPGDKEHTLEKIVKVVSGMDAESLERIAAVYERVCAAGVHRAATIKTAEAAKVIENVQRDLNIALVNELALIFSRMGISTRDVLEAAGTKWNFHRYSPGLVGGHCYSGSHRITLLNGHQHKVRTLSDYFNELQEHKMVHVERVGDITLFWPKETLRALSFDKDSGQAIFSPVKCFSLQKGTQGLRITTAGNHHVEVSTRHPMIVDESGEWFVKHAQDLKIGDRLPLLQNLPQRSGLRTEIDLIKEIPVTWHNRYRVKRKFGAWKDLKDVLNIKKHTNRKPSNFYATDYLPLSIYLALEKKGVMRIPRQDVLLVSGRGGGSFQAVPAVIPLNADFARLVGYYLSEGCITHDKTTRVRFTFNRNEKETIKDCCALIKQSGVLRFSRFEDKQWNASHIKVSSELLGFLFETLLNLGVRSEDARIPEELLYASDAIRWNLLTGLLRGDGGVDWSYSHRPYRKNGKIYRHARNLACVNYFSISPELFHGIQLLLMSFGIPFTLDKKRPLLEVHGTECLSRLRHCFLDAKGRKLENYFHHKLKAPRSKIFVSHPGYVTVPVKKIKPIPLEQLYSLEVEGTHTVVTDGGLITHNCIGVDPYYLTYRAEELGYHPQVILAGRRINDFMPVYVGELMVKGLIQAGKKVKEAKVLVLGLTFKEDVKDPRNSKSVEVIETLKAQGVEVFAHDPLLSAEEAAHECDVAFLKDFKAAGPFDGIVFVVPHANLRSIPLSELNELMTQPGVLIDVKGVYAKEARPEGLVYSML